MKYLKKYIFFLAIIISLQTNATSSFKPLLWNINRLDYIKQNRNKIYTVQNLLKNANDLIHDDCISVTQKKSSFSNDKQNYESLSSYFWPNPDNPNAPYIERDGVLNPETKTDDRSRLNEVTDRIVKLSLAYYITEDIKYYKACLRQIKVWFLNKDTRMHPHFKYAQVIKNYKSNKGQPHGIIDAYVMNNILESIRLLDYQTGVKKKIKEDLQKWFEDFAIWLTTDELGILESKQKNNHSIAYDVLLLNISLFTENKQRADFIITNFKKKRLDVLIKEDGSQPGEQRRTRSYYYSYYNLIHIVDFCQILQSININYYLSYRNPIDQSFKYLEAYFENQKLYPYREIGNWNNIVKGIKIECERLNRLASEKNVAKSFAEYNSNFFDNIYTWIK